MKTEGCCGKCSGAKKAEGASCGTEVVLVKVGGAPVADAYHPVAGSKEQESETH